MVSDYKVQQVSKWIAIAVSITVLVGFTYKAVDSFFLMQAGALNAVPRAEYRAEIDQLKSQFGSRLIRLENNTKETGKKVDGLRTDIAKMQGTLLTLLDVQREMIRRQ